MAAAASKGSRSQQARQSARGSAFPHNVALLNPHFEAYRLIVPPSQGETSAAGTSSWRLPSSASLTSLTSVGLKNGTTDSDKNNSSSSKSSSVLGFKELKDRLDTPRLIPGSSPNQLAYIDDAGFVVLLVLDHDARPKFHPLCRIASSEDLSDRYDGVASSLVALPGEKWAVMETPNRLTVLQTEQQGKRLGANVVASVEIETAPGSASYRILQGRLNDDQASVLILLQSNTKVNALGQDGEMTSQTEFSVCLVNVPLPATPPAQEIDSIQTNKIRPQWRCSGPQAIYFAQLHASRHSLGHILVSEAPLTASDKGKSISELPNFPAAPRSGSTVEATSKTDTKQHGIKLPPFSWAQTDDSVTLVFQLPPSIRSNHIRVHFSPQGMSIHLAASAELTTSASAKIVELKGDDDEEAEAEDGANPEEGAMLKTAKAILREKYASRSLWAPISPSDSVWTWETIGGPASGTVHNDTGKRKRIEKGLLTIHLDKRNEGVRWPQVFGQEEKSKAAREKGAASQPMIGGSNSATKKDFETLAREQQHAEEEGKISDSNDSDAESYADEPPETVDPSELLMMLEGLEKYTVDAEHDGPAIPRTSTSGVPGLGPDLSGGFAQRESLLHDSLEPEDADVGRPLVVTTVQEIDGDIKIEPAAPEDTNRACLALPLSSSASSNGVADEGSSAAVRSPIVVRRDLDGLVYLAPDHTGEAKWQHDDTLSALSFVLASKRDLRGVWVYQSENKSKTANQASSSSSSSPLYRSVALAIESPPPTSSAVGSSQGSGDSAGNLFVYYSNWRDSASDGQQQGRGKGKSERDMYAASRVIRLDDPLGESTGAFIGVASVSTAAAPQGGGENDDGGESKLLLAILCEKRLLLLPGIL